MYSIYDKQIGSYLHSGRNSKTKEDAINIAIEFLYADSATCAPSEIKKFSLVKKEGLIKRHDLLVCEHEKEIEGECDGEFFFSFCLTYNIKTNIMANSIVKLMKKNMSKRTSQVTTACTLESDFTSGGFITKLTVVHSFPSNLPNNVLFLNLHEIQDLKNFLETLL